MLNGFMLQFVAAILEIKFFQKTFKDFYPSFINKKIEKDLIEFNHIVQEL